MKIYIHSELENQKKPRKGIKVKMKLERKRGERVTKKNKPKGDFLAMIVYDETRGVSEVTHLSPLSIDDEQLED